MRLTSVLWLFLSLFLVACEQPTTPLIPAGEQRSALTLTFPNPLPDNISELYRQRFLAAGLKDIQVSQSENTVNLVLEKIGSVEIAKFIASIPGNAQWAFVEESAAAIAPTLEAVSKALYRVEDDRIIVNDIALFTNAINTLDTKPRFVFHPQKTGIAAYLVKTVVINNEDFLSISAVNSDNGFTELVIKLSDAAGQQLQTLTKDHIGQQMVTLIDNSVITNATIQGYLGQDVRLNLGASSEERLLQAQVWALLMSLEPLPSEPVISAEQ